MNFNSKLNSLFKKIIFFILIFSLPLAVVELFFRSVSYQHGHVLRLLNKPWYTILPLDIPDKSSYKKEQNIKSTSYRVYDPMLGWKINSNGKHPPLYFSSSYGSRVPKSEYQMEVNSRKADIITIGDSFTHGDEVSCEDSWPYLLGQLRNEKVVNFGVSGYGIDQAILSYLYSPIKTETVVLGIISGDFERATNIVYRGIYYGGNRSKPMFYFKDDGSYELKNQPCLSGIDLWNEFNLGVKSDFFKYDKSYDDILFKKGLLNKLFSFRILKMLKYRFDYIRPPIYLKINNDPNYEYILKILKVFYEECERNKSFPIILLLDNNNTFADRKKYLMPWNHIIADLEEIGFFVIEPSNKIVEMHNNDPLSIINKGGVHYTPLANEIVAEYVHKNLKKHFNKIR